MANTLRFFLTLYVVTIFACPTLGQDVESDNSVQEPIYVNPSDVSFGTYSYSLLFTPDDTKEYLGTILRYEREGVGAFALDEEEAQRLAEINGDSASLNKDPINFTHQSLSSLLYNHPSSWMVRINGITITADTNKQNNPLYVTFIDKNHARFLWTPQDERLVPALTDLLQNNALLTLPDTMTHRAVRIGDNQAAIIQNDSSISFTLEPNQSLATGYFAIIEGNTESVPPAQYASIASTNDENVNQSPVAQWQLVTVQEKEPDIVTESNTMPASMVDERQFFEDNKEKKTLEERFREMMLREGL